MLKIAIIVGSTRPGRQGAAVANWVMEQAKAREGVEYELIDLADYPLPFLDEAAPPVFARYANEHTKAWSKVVSAYDGYVFVTPEYNHSTTAVLKNAIDFLYVEWNNKAGAVVSYGGARGGARAGEHVRQILGHMKIACVRAQVLLTFRHDFTEFTSFTPSDGQDLSLVTLFEELELWAGALASLRVPLDA